MVYFLTLNTQYKDVEIGLFNDNKDIITKETIVNKDINKYLLNTLSDILNKNNIHFHDLAFIAANQGPAPFTTLRVVLATLNGLNFASQVPLIGINGLNALLNQYQDKENKLTIALLNAYGQDLYYAFQYQDQYETGCQNYLILLNQIKERFAQESLVFIGNGADLYQKEIKSIFDNKADIPNPNIESASIETISQEAIKSYKTQNTVFELLPVYLKDSINSISK